MSKKKEIQNKDFKIESLEQYKSYAFRTCPDLGTKEKNLEHMITGILTEIGELSDVYKKEFAYNKKLDFVNISEEWADQIWYCVTASNFKSFSLSIDNDFQNFFLRTQINTKPIMLAGIESAKYFVSSLTHKNYLNLYLNWLWYLADRLNIDKFDSLTKNILKLAERYGENFSDIKAINRNVIKERETLEKNIEDGE